MKKSLSLIVALAMVVTLLAPAMAFAATQEQNLAGERLEKYGILQGDGQGDLYLDNPLPREHMMVMLARLFGQEEEARNTPNTHGWSDVEDPYYHGFISWAKNEGLTKGVGDGSKFGYKQILNIQSLLQLSLRALGYNDVAWEDVRAKSIELGLISADVDVTRDATRGDMAVVTLATLGTPVNGSDEVLGAVLGIEDFIEDEVVGDVEIASFKAVGARKLAVEFNEAVDPSAAKISIKRGTNNVSFGKAEWSNGNKTVTLELNSKLFEGQYDVTVSGVAEEALTASVAVENERVASLEITTGDVIPLPRVEAPSKPLTVEVKYVARNQYGEETKETVEAFATVNSQKMSSANGTLTISKSSGEEFKVDDQFTLTVYHIETALQVQKTFKIGESSVASDIKVIGLHHADNKELAANSTVGEFKLLVEIKDQYGNVMLDPSEVKKDVDVAVVGNFNLRLKDPAKDKFNDVERIYYELDKINSSEDLRAGTALINLMSIKAAAVSQYYINIAEGLKIDRVILQPVGDLVAAGEKYKVPVIALDQHGNEITDVGLLNDAKDQTPNPRINVNVAANSEFKKDGDFLYLEVQSGGQGTEFVNVVSETGKPSMIQVTVQEAARPVIITGIASDQNTLVFYAHTLNLEPKSFVVEDQYGRVMSEGDLKKHLGTTNGKYKIVASDAGDHVKFHEVSNVPQNELADENGKIVLKGEEKGKDTLKFELYLRDGVDENNNPKWKLVNGSEFSNEFRTVVITEIETVEASDLGTVYDDSNDNYAKEVKVTGVTSDGKRVTIPYAEYNVYAPGETTVIPDVNSFKVRADGFSYGNDENEKGFSVRIVINKLGKELTINGTASKHEPKIDQIVFKNNDDNTITEQKVGKNDKIDLSWIVDRKIKLELKDQYGVEAKFNNDTSVNFYQYGTGKKVSEPTLTFSNIEVGDKDGKYPEISNNGSTTASIDLSKADGNVKSFNLTVNFGGKAATIKIIVE